MVLQAGTSLARVEEKTKSEGSLIGSYISWEAKVNHLPPAFGAAHLVCTSSTAKRRGTGIIVGH